MEKPEFPIEQALTDDITPVVRLERLDDNLFRSRFGKVTGGGRIFGGQILAQALAAATATIEGRTCHSLHGYFLRAGDATQRVLFKVERTRDGGRFAARRVIAEQASRAIFHLECSFHAPEPGFEHQTHHLPDVPPPEDVPDAATVADMIGADRPWTASLMRVPNPIDMRLIDYRFLTDSPEEARRRMWLRLPSAARTDDPEVHQQLIAYLSDYWLLSAALVPHPIAEKGQGPRTASLDHAVWFHRPHRADDWLLFDCKSPWAANGRGLSHGSLLDREGRLVATVMQESLMRIADPR